MKQIASSLLFIVLFTSCATTIRERITNKPIYNIQNAAVGAGMTKEKLKQAIEMAAKGRGWLVEKEEPGKITLNLRNRKHTAKILVSYSQTNYNINYLDSTNLEYNKEKQTIHRNYNRWIEYLDNDIRRNM